MTTVCRYCKHQPPTIKQISAIVLKTRLSYRLRADAFHFPKITVKIHRDSPTNLWYREIACPCFVCDSFSCSGWCFYCAWSVIRILQSRDAVGDNGAKSVSQFVFLASVTSDVCLCFLTSFFCDSVYCEFLAFETINLAISNYCFV